ncbi:hypothetical protein DS901_10660 [Loktanella sp. D2R18]|uniref:hypothetical protein n=1 Tax=Rhodobacterales TaxID=204455 RepID=UPI000DEB4E69|nr:MULTISPECIES: hypothetical protein [Rhodobacterales]MDO6590853.1 hypothetical protein [Yoonia sp. 1_MG-2023]RBW43279.1 hypothetical protein DS901_10660 [Loktanella sp. D2R18]
MARPLITDPDPVSRVAVGFAVGWLVLLGVLFLLVPPLIVTDAGFDSLRFVALIVVTCLPVAVALLVAAGLRAHRKLRDDAFRMQSALDALRQTRASQPAPQRPVDTKPVQKPQAAPESKPAAVSVAPASASALDPIDLIRALNFPNTEDDAEGFAALRAALRDPQARQLVQASQDVLTLLSQDGIYMDDLKVTTASAELWRKFAAGTRGAAIAGLGGVADPAALAAVMHRKKDDTIFRDSMLHFLRYFDKMLAQFLPEISDDALLILAETRSARAFMLLGRAVGTFE